MNTRPSPGDAVARSERADFIRAIIDEDLAEGRHGGRVVTRFPPEPNGYLHIGHAKAICLNFGIAEEYGARPEVEEARCHLRFDDTNPLTEEEEYAHSIREAVRWLGFDWGDHLYYASDYLETFYQYAVKLIKNGKAYVDSQSEEEMRRRRGTVTAPGEDSPYRERTPEENLGLFERMRAGEFPDGAHVLRAKIDMAAPLMILRDPPLFRIRRAHHYRSAAEGWTIWPMYDFAHPLEDAIEGVTHSLCTLEFDNNRRVYDWVLEHCLDAEALPDRPRQYEFARLNLGYTVMSKRKLLQLVEEGHVQGWDDPRLPTIFGLRRRGVTSEAIRAFCTTIGITRADSRVEIGLFEHTLRDDLNAKAPRVMAVLDPLKVTLTSFPEGETDWIEAPYWPHDVKPPENQPEKREVPFTRTLYIERDDFSEEPPEGFYRLAPGREVRLRYGYFITCEDVIKDEDGEVIELRCTHDPSTRGGDAPDGRSPAGTIHWVSEKHAVPAEVRLYDRLFSVPDPDAREGDFREHLNPDSLRTLQACVEPSVKGDAPGTRYQFERQGYFWPDPEDSSPEALVFNQIVPLRDTWAEREQAQRRDLLKQRRREKEAEKKRQRRLAEKAERDPAAGFSPEQRARFERYRQGLGLDAADAALLAEDAALAAFFERAIEAHEEPHSVANWIVNELMRALKETPLDALPFGAAALGRLVALLDEDAISSRAAKTVFEEMLQTGADPEAVVAEKGLRQMDDAEALKAVAEEVVAAHPDEAARYREGKKGLIGFFMGRVMQKTRGKANPEQARTLLQDALGD